MPPEAGAGVAWARGGGNHAAGAEFERVLRVRDGRQRAAERELQNMSPALLFSAEILMTVLVLSAAHPPAWIKRARDTGEQLLRACLFELLNRSAFLLAVALVCVLCAHRVRSAPAEGALAAARALYGAFLALFQA